MATSQNGYPVLGSGDYHNWKLPGINRTLNLAPKGPGFVLAFFAHWFDQYVERLDVGEWDDWAWASRPIRGSQTTSNHASGTAIDLNATRHPLGTDPRANFTPKQIRRIRNKLRILRGVIRWGGDYSGRKDGMHFEINASRKRVDALAKILRLSKRGRAIVKANN